MEAATSPRKKLKSPAQDCIINPRVSITCSNVPEGLFDATAAKKHFSKFGRVQRIRLFPKRQICIIDYDLPSAADRAVLNAGAYDGFMFDVTRSKARVRRRSSKKDDDPDWVPDSDVEEELSAMGGAPSYRATRTRENHPELTKPKIMKKPNLMTPVKKKLPVVKKHPSMIQPVSGTESPVLMPTASSMSTFEAASELHQLRSKVSLTPDEQWRILEARDRILRAWGGAGSRVKVGGATIGTCQDMCPEKELLHRQAEHQVMTLETAEGGPREGQMEAWRAVKQYSRSSADQEIPMCYELRPAAVLARTTSYLLREVADTKRQVSLADWFHFMWDRFRSIRKDITQQALCCDQSIQLVEACARFHAHCAARLADLEHTQFDQKLNTDNLTKCLQTLKHMYADVGAEHKPNEAEFRGYVALLNLGDANFWWEIKQLPREIQKSEPLIFATQVFNALDNNNYVRFFRLVQEKATYLQACILLRYFNDVRARALARIVKAYAPRGGSRFPAEDMMNALAFESVESMKCFVHHYGLRISTIDETELSIILDRNQFIEDSDPYPLSRAISLIESKRKNTVGEVIAGGQLPSPDYKNHVLYSSFTMDGKLKEAALLAEDQGYNTINDSEKNVQTLKDEIRKLSQGQRFEIKTDSRQDIKPTYFAKPEPKTLSPVKSQISFGAPLTPKFSFKPAIPVASTDVIKNSPEKVLPNEFSFSKPQESLSSDIFPIKSTSNPFMKQAPAVQSFFETKTENRNPFGTNGENKDLFKSAGTIFKSSENKTDASNVFKLQESKKPVFSQLDPQNKSAASIFGKAKEIVTAKPDSTVKFNNNSNSFFAKPTPMQVPEKAQSIFGSFDKSKLGENTNIFKPNTDGTSVQNSIFTTNGNVPSSKLSPGSIFKSALHPPNGEETKQYSIFPSKNKGSTVADSIFNSVQNIKGSVYEFTQDDENHLQPLVEQNQNEESRKLKEEQMLQEQMRIEAEQRMEASKRQEEERRKEEERRREEERRIEEEKRKEEERRKQEELRQLEEKRRREEERKQEELRRKIEEEKKAELKRKAEEERKFKERVERESSELINELIDEINDESVKSLMREEKEKLDSLMAYAGIVTEEVFSELCNEICHSEMKAEKFWTEKLMKKWFFVWRKQLKTNLKRRMLLEDTPVWLTDRTPVEEAVFLRRFVEDAALKNMNAVHRGYKFNGELKLPPPPEPYNLMEIIRSPLLKRMKQINYPYNKSFFWKVTLVSSGASKWLYKKVEVDKWLKDAFSDKKKHDASESLIQVGKHSWNNLMDFAISVTLISDDTKHCSSEAIEGTNGLLFYATEKDHNLPITVELTLKSKYLYQIVPIAIIMPNIKDMSEYGMLETTLTNLVNSKVISAFKIFVLDDQNVPESINLATKTALRWLAKKCPQNPPIEIDVLKSICQRYLGNEIWCQLKIENDSRVSVILKDINKLIKLYNVAVDKLTEVITNEDLFNYPSFPLEFRVYLDETSPYPKPFEFISSSVKQAENITAIKNMMERLKLPEPKNNFKPISVSSMQQGIRQYCNQIGWFENPEEVACKVVALLPNEFSDLAMPYDQFIKHFANFDLIDILNVIVYEKINSLNNFDNRYAIYESSVLEEYRNADWLYDISVIANMKHKALEYEDDLDLLIEAKRRKIAIDSMEYLMLEDKDSTIVEENIKATEENISMYNNCTEAVKQLEEQLENEKKKSMELENLLKLALSDV